MPNKIARQSNRRKLFFTSIVALVFVIGILCIEYYRYAYIVNWHYIHGNFAEIGRYRVSLPYLWWKNGTESNNSSFLLRACPLNTFSKPELEVSPAIPGEVMDTEQEELKSTQKVISALNHKGIEGWSQSLVTLTPRSFTLYCIRQDEVLYRSNIDTILTCHAAKLPYSFRYSGPSAYEKEAESILSSLE